MHSQKEKILEALNTPKSLDELEKVIKIKRDSLRGRLSELRYAGLIEKNGHNWKVTNEERRSDILSRLNK